MLLYLAIVVIVALPYLFDRYASRSNETRTHRDH